MDITSSATHTGDSGSVGSHTIVSEVISSSGSRITDQRLKGSSNYLQWKKIVLLALRGQGKHKHLTALPPDESFDPVGSDKWLQDDARIFSQLLNYMEPAVGAVTTHCDTVKELWEFLAILYTGKLNMSRVYDVLRSLCGMTQQGRSVTEYFGEFKALFEEFNCLLPIDADPKKAKEQREQLGIIWFLSGLESEFDSARSQILSSSDVTSLTDTFSRVVRISRHTPLAAPSSTKIHDRAALLNTPWVDILIMNILMIGDVI